ncbi:hypothetical protein [Streptomyces sp. NPDC059787]|uniref:hypothetical protein n=1 Tax=Streptomyces sp. NPDC059787 TaxID=3346947 RepID=UPI003655844C
MSNRTARFFEPLLRLLLPGRGRHRHTEVPPGRHARVPCAGAPTTRRFGAPILRGEDDAVVRPYLVAHERAEEARRQQARRRALRLAVHGIDIEPRVVHRVEVTA